MTDQISTLSRIRGSLLGGGIGDALGAAPEFMSLSEIRARFGPSGVTGYLPAYGREVAITDDTQMTMFSAEGLLLAETAEIGGLVESVRVAYLDWLATQSRQTVSASGRSALAALPALRSLRAPGNTCLSALRSGGSGSPEQRLNDSKGCGGVMRAAPFGLVYEGPQAFEIAVRCAALTHGHPSGYLSAGFLAQTIAGICAGLDLRAAIDETLPTLCGWDDHEETLAWVERALYDAARKEAVAETVESFGGGGWVGEEALAIALFCALKADDFRHGVLLAVNHSGDADSTAAITGNILGALLGSEALPETWVSQLELVDQLERLAVGLARLRDADAA